MTLILLNGVLVLQVVKLLAYISDKDLFAEFYRYNLTFQIMISYMFTYVI